MKQPQLKKVTRNQVRALLRRLPKSESLAVWVCPCKMRPEPEHPFNMATRIAISWEGFRMDTMEAYNSGDTLDAFVSRFTYYNCNGSTGKYVHYYIEEGAEEQCS